MFDSIFKVVKDVADIALAPVSMVADVTRAVTTPVAKAANEIAAETKELVDDVVDE